MYLKLAYATSRAAVPINPVTTMPMTLILSLGLKLRSMMIGGMERCEPQGSLSDSGGGGLGYLLITRLGTPKVGTGRKRATGDGSTELLRPLLVEAI
jgi:hypothetical protein